MALTTLADVKAFKNVTTTEHDLELVRLMPVVQAFIEAECNRTLNQGTGLVEYYSTVPGQTTLLLRRPPVSSITSIYDDPERSYGASTLLDSTDYVLTDEEAGLLTFPSYRTSGGVHNLKVTYTGGYTAAELALLAQAAIELIWLARDKGDGALLGINSKSVADGSVTIRNDWPSGVDAILDLYRLRR